MLEERRKQLYEVYKVWEKELKDFNTPTYDGSGTILESTGITIRSESI
jgi:hypothetical protein